MSETASRDMLTDLQQHFTGSHTPREDSAVAMPIREPPDIQHGPPLNLQLPGIDNLPYRLAANGSSTDHEGTGAYAAITCVADHSLPHGRWHESEIHLVRLDAYPNQEQVNGEWVTWRQPLLAGLGKDPGAKRAHIEITGADCQLVGRLTAYEADQLAEILQKLAAMLREERRTETSPGPCQHPPGSAPRTTCPN